MIFKPVMTKRRFDKISVVYEPGLKKSDWPICRNSKL
jgi:hypothetical protein